MEQALLRPIAQADLPEAVIQIDRPAVAVHGFDPIRKMMATTHRDGDEVLRPSRAHPKRCSMSAAM